MFCFIIALIFSALCSFLKVFSAKRGHLKLFIQSQEFFRTLQRHYSNTCIDANKQAAINLYVYISASLAEYSVPFSLSVVVWV